MSKVYKNPGPIEFEAVVQEVQMRNNTATWIDFPYDLKETYGVGNLVPFKVTFDGRVHYQGSLAKMGGPKAMILLRSDVQAELGKRVGDKVHVKVELDTSKREIKLSKDVQQAYIAAGVWEAFKKFPYSHQREYDMWIEGAKKPETRARRIEKSVDELLKKQKAQP